MIIMAALLACTSSEPATPDTGYAPIEDLEIPDFSGINKEQAYLDALSIALTVNTMPAWAAHKANSARYQTGCPDIYVGLVPEDAEDAIEDGVTWSDTCQTNGGLYFSGYASWVANAIASGDASTVEGRTSEGSRTLVGNQTIGDDNGVRFEFDGEASDSVFRVDADGYQRWTYTSLVDGTVGGSDAFGPGDLTPNGWRTDQYLFMAGGDTQRVESRGNVYLFEPTIQGVFDSIAMDLVIQGQQGASPDDCLLEPRGWIGIRDENAFWLDLVFLPLDEEDITGVPYPNDPLSECDGCGTLYIRGQESGEVCVDFSSVFANEAYAAPAIEEFVFTLRDIPLAP